jgi:hypothetical protein
MAAVTTHRAAGLPKCGAFLHVLPSAQYDSPSTLEKTADLFKSSWSVTQYIFFNYLNQNKSWTLSRATCYNQISIL